jgi:hypothetical protein
VTTPPILIPSWQSTPDPILGTDTTSHPCNLPQVSQPAALTWHSPLHHATPPPTTSPLTGHPEDALFPSHHACNQCTFVPDPDPASHSSGHSFINPADMTPDSPFDWSPCGYDPGPAGPRYCLRPQMPANIQPTPQALAPEGSLPRSIHQKCQPEHILMLPLFETKFLKMLHFIVQVYRMMCLQNYYVLVSINDSLHIVTIVQCGTLLQNASNCSSLLRML